ncbi:hypothetical protein CA984_33450 [Streptosporangium minutum]|uniref:Uncharacterized protein n=1 Tax=Streptosporangium minutum TaxID=569862 RepID=A0A243RC18_9ACTN|nr:hypothetical protein CA984_33450 [Streptosporangium minutum]
MECTDGAEVSVDRINDWLGAWRLNQSHAQDRDRGEARRIWARVAFAALDGAEQAGYPMRNADADRFHLRALLIVDLAPDDDPLWSPDQLASDVLEALPLGLEQARAWVTDWRMRPRHEILALRTCKNLLGPMESIADRLAIGPVRTQIDRWLDLRAHLP